MKNIAQRWKIKESITKVKDALGWERKTIEVELPMEDVLLCAAEFLKTEMNDSLWDDKITVDEIVITVTETGMKQAPQIVVNLPEMRPEFNVNVPEQKPRRTTVKYSDLGRIESMETSND